MALNKYMHPRNVYKTRKPDFKQLALKYEYFRERVTQNLNGKVILEFKDPASLRALTRALLEEDFGLLVSLPVDRLIPTVPQRLNYILWLEDIIGAKTQAKGIDIGTGASCIYPLLGCRKNGWEFLATDIDDQNILFATQNIEGNQLQDKIKIKKVKEDKLLLGVVEDTCTYDFSMCNPPFFSDHLEAQGVSSTRSEDRPEPKSLSTASEGESIAWGGEVRFVCQMIEESLILKDKIRVYTSMLGKKMSLSLIKDQLVKKKITRFSSTEFCQGRTMRWAIAWTFDETLQFPKSSFKELKKPTVSSTFEIPRSVKAVKDYTVQAFTEFMRSEMEELKINYHVRHSGKFYTYLILQAKENTWSHQRRKRRKEKFATMNKSQEADGTATIQSNCANSQPQCNKTERKESEAIQLTPDNNPTQCNETGSKECLNIDVKKALNDTDEADNIKELKNVQNFITKGQDKSVENNMDVELCLKRKLEESSSEQNGKRCKTVDKVISSDPNQEKSTHEDIVIEISEESTQTPNNSGDNHSTIEHSKCIEPVESVIKEGNTLSNDQNNTENKTEHSQLINETKIEDVTQETVSEHNNSDKHSSKNTEVVTESKSDKEDKEILDSNKTEGTEDSSKGSKVTEEDTLENSDSSSNQMKSREEIIKQFWKEQEAYKPGGKKRVPHSEYEKMEMFEETEECLALIKLMIRKDEGTVTFNLTHMAGRKEAVHQIVQYLRNKLT